MNLVSKALPGLTHRLMEMALPRFLAGRMENQTMAGLLSEMMRVQKRSLAVSIQTAEKGRFLQLIIPVLSFLLQRSLLPFFLRSYFQTGLILQGSLLMGLVFLFS